MSFSIKYEKSKKMASRSKKTKSLNVNTTTVDAKHKEYMSKFDQLQHKILPMKEKQLSQKEKQLHRLTHKKPLEPIEYNIILQLRKEISQLENEIIEIQNKKDEKSYLLNTIDALRTYHDNKTGVTTSEPTTNNNITDYFSQKGKITSYIPIRAKTDKNRGEIYDDYMKNADPEYISQKRNSSSSKTSGANKIRCKCGLKANITYDFTSGRNICETCGTILVHFFDSQFTSYKESQDHDIPVDFPYIRMNHFNELISQFQAKEQTDIPDYVFEKLQKEFETERIEYESLCYKLVKRKLRVLGMENMYEHIPYIIHKFNGKPPPVLSLEQEQKFRKMFKQIQGPFERCKHLARKNRKNFLSYHYVFYKFAELLCLDHLLQYFRLLQSREKLFSQDKVWEAICDIMEWEFIASL
jgi:hypothetical protein